MGYNSDTLTGKTRELVLARVNKEDTGQKVVLTEDSGWGGGCETCAFDYNDLTLTVDGEQVFSSSGDTITAFLTWLNEDPDDG